MSSFTCGYCFVKKKLYICALYDKKKEEEEKTCLLKEDKLFCQIDNGKIILYTLCTTLWLHGTTYIFQFILPPRTHSMKSLIHTMRQINIWNVMAASHRRLFSIYLTYKILLIFPLPSLISLDSSLSQKHTLSFFAPLTLSFPHSLILML